MTSNQAIHFLQSDWYWDGSHIVRVDRLTWRIEKFVRDDSSNDESATPGSDIVSIPGGPRFELERDSSGTVCVTSKYGPDGSYAGSVFHDSNGSPVYKEDYNDRVLDSDNMLTKVYFYPNGSRRIEEKLSKNGARPSRTDWDEEGNIIWHEDYDPLLNWLGWQGWDKAPAYPEPHLCLRR